MVLADRRGLRGCALDALTLAAHDPINDDRQRVGQSRRAEVANALLHEDVVRELTRIVNPSKSKFPVEPPTLMCAFDKMKRIRSAPRAVASVACGIRPSRALRTVSRVSSQSSTAVPTARPTEAGMHMPAPRPSSAPERASRFEPMTLASAPFSSTKAQISAVEFRSEYVSELTPRQPSPRPHPPPCVPDDPPARTGAPESGTTRRTRLARKATSGRSRR